MPSDNWIRVSDIAESLMADFKAGRIHKRTEDRMTFEDWEAQPDPVDEDEDGEEA